MNQPQLTYGTVLNELGPQSMKYPYPVSGFFYKAFNNDKENNQKTRFTSTTIPHSANQSRKKY